MGQGYYSWHHRALQAQSTFEEIKQCVFPVDHKKPEHWAKACPNVPGKCPKELLRDIVSADGIFECKEELVVFLNHGIALQIARASVCWPTIFVSTLAKNIHLDAK